MLTPLQSANAVELITKLKEIAQASNSNLAIAFLGENEGGESVTGAFVTYCTEETRSFLHSVPNEGAITMAVIERLDGCIRKKAKVDAILAKHDQNSLDGLAAILKELSEDGLSDA